MYVYYTKHTSKCKQTWRMCVYQLTLHNYVFMAASGATYVCTWISSSPIAPHAPSLVRCDGALWPPAPALQRGGTPWGGRGTEVSHLPANPGQWRPTLEDWVWSEQFACLSLLQNRYVQWCISILACKRYVPLVKCILNTYAPCIHTYLCALVCL